MTTAAARTLLLAAAIALGLATAACGGSDPEAEATWETHTTAEDQSSGDEAPAAEAPAEGSGEATAPAE